MSDMSDFEQLKPCPFCGGEVKLEQTLKRTGWGVVCRNSSNLGGTCAIEQIPSKEKQAAITRWNTRAAKQSMQGDSEHVAIYEQDTNHLQELMDTDMAKGWRWMRKDFAKGDKLYTHAPDSAARIAEQDAEIARLQKELEEARKDADRYRWLRNESASHIHYSPTATLCNGFGIKVRYGLHGDPKCQPYIGLVGETLDQAIDSVMQDASINIKGGAE